MNCLLINDGLIVAALDATSSQECNSAVNDPSTPAYQYMLVVSNPGDSPQGGDSGALPSTDQLAAAWGASFVLVVGCYVIARQIGAVLNFIK